MLPNEKWKKDFDYLVCYVGVIGSQEEIENLLEIARITVIDKAATNVRFIIVGTGSYWNRMVKLTEDMNLSHYVHFTGFVPYKDFYEILATSDVCVNPEHRNEFTDRSTMIKIMDYLTFGKPVVMFETTEGKVTAGERCIYLKENDNYQFAETLLDLLFDEDKRKKMGDSGWRRVEEKLKWSIQKLNLKKAYAFLAQKKK